MECLGKDEHGVARFEFTNGAIKQSFKFGPRFYGSDESEGSGDGPYEFRTNDN